MGNFEFKSQICTSRSQSEKLLALGLKKETADLTLQYDRVTEDYKLQDIPFSRIMRLREQLNKRPILGWSGDDLYVKDIPAWSLHRLMEIMPKNIGCYEQFVSCYKNDVMYIDDDGYSFFNRTKNDNLYDGIIDCIKWAIVNQYINQQFLEDKK